MTRNGQSSFWKRLLAVAATLLLVALPAFAAGDPVLLKDIQPGSAGSRPSNFAEFDGLLFFAANDGTNGRELWRSDGTVGGTDLFKDIQPGSAGSRPAGLTEFGGELFFRADDGTHGAELWKSDGTAAGTVLVKNIQPGSAGSKPTGFTAAGGSLFFRADDGTHGAELWKTDGTTAGTVLVKDIRPGSYGSGARLLTEVGSSLYFSAVDDPHGWELWKSDGTPAGTAMVKDIRSETGSSKPWYLTEFQGSVFFQANDGIDGYELWKSDGTEAGTVLLKNIAPGGKHSSSSPRHFIEFGGSLFFFATGGGIWKTDGTTAGTVLVKNVRVTGPSTSAWGPPKYFTEFGGSLFFSGSVEGSTDYELWKSDGTELGTVLVKDIQPGMAGSSNPSEFTEFGGELFFRAHDETNDGFELWKTDGTAAGTLLVKVMQPGLSRFDSAELTVAEGLLFFRADDGTHGLELWACPIEIETVSVTCPPDQDAECGVLETLTFGVDQSGGKEVTVTFTVDGVPVPAQTKVVPPLGVPTTVDFDYAFGGPAGTTFDVEATATDPSGRTANCSMAVTSTDTKPPVGACIVLQRVLWPATGNHVTVGFSAQFTDACGGAITPISVTVYSDEPNGSAPPDAEQAGAGWKLRAERDGQGNGRVYLLVAEATDAAGNTGFTCCTAVVPKNNGASARTAVLLEAAMARNACELSGTGDPGAYTQVSP